MQRFVFFLSLAFLFLLMGLPVYSINIDRFEYMDTGSGLSQNNVLSIFCDNQGFMWFGTMDGLNRYDGYNFEVFKSEIGNVHTLTNNRISDIWEDKLNVMWVKTYDGYYHYYTPDNKHFTTFPFYSRSVEERNSKISCFYQSNPTELWLGSTNSGVYFLQYDRASKRYRSRQFLSRGITSVTNNTISFVIADSKKNIWIGTRQGLNRITDKEKHKPQPLIEHFLAKYSFTCAVEFQGYLLFGTHESGIIRYDPKSGRFEENDPLFRSLKGVNITELRRSEETGNLLISTSDSGLLVYYAVQKQIVPYTQYGKRVVQLHEDSYGQIWFDTENFGIMRIDPLTYKCYYYNLIAENLKYIIDSERPQFYEDSEKNLWICTHGGGLVLYNRLLDNFFFYHNTPDDPNTISSDFVYCIREDKSGMLWAGTGQYKAGINKIIKSNPSFQQVIPQKKLQSLADNVVRCLFEDHNGCIWMTTKSGRVYIYTADFKLLHTLENVPFDSDEIPGFNIYDIEEDSHGYIWLGSKGGGLMISRKPLSDNIADYQNISFYWYRHSPEKPNSLCSDFVYSLREDRFGRMWVGTYGGGISVVEARTENTLICKQLNTVSSGLSSNQVRCIHEDTQGRMWVATVFGLNVYPNQKNLPDSIPFQRFFYNPEDAHSISYNDIIEIYEDSHNQLWFCSFGGGVNRLERFGEEVSFVHFDTHNGLLNDAVFSLLDDASGNLWMSSERGISRMERKTLTVDNYTRNNGLHTETFSEHASCKTASGLLLFGSCVGTLVIDPRQIYKSMYLPPIQLTNFQLFNRDVDIEAAAAPFNKSIEVLDTLILQYDQNSFSFEYAALSYYAPLQNHYAFILENFDKTWNEVGNQRKATYTNVAPGKYTFRVKAANWDGTWNATSRNIYIHILPPWWKTTWAYILYVVFSIVLFEVARRIFLKYYTLQNDLQVERKVNDIKLQFFTDISHEIRTPLTLIMGPIEDIKNSDISVAVAEKIEIMERNGKRMLRLVNQLLDFRKIQKNKMTLQVREVELVAFTRDIFQHFQPLAGRKNVDYIFESSLDELPVYIDPKKFDSVVFNLLSNAFKYSSGGKKIVLSIFELDNQVNLVVKDEGKGISKEQVKFLFERFSPLSSSGGDTLGTGIGLSLSYEIVKLHKGTMSVESDAGKGASFIIKLSKGKKHFNTADFATNAEVVAFDTASHYIDTDSDFPQPGLSKTHDKPSLLIVEDNPEIVSYLMQELSDAYQINTAENGQKAIDLLQTLHPDLIVTDVMMPVMDGVEFTRIIKAQAETSHIPVVMLTAKSNIEDQISGVESGAEAYILKPFSTHYLSAVLNNLLKQRHVVIQKYRDKKVIPEANIKISGKDDEFMTEMVKIIENNYADPEFNVERMVNLSNFSRTVMYNKMKGLTGMSPVEFIRQMRLKIASTMLSEGGRAVSETAYMTGFNDVKYFSKCFKELYGVSPKDYKGRTVDA